MAADYLHGYSEEERRRLVEQALFMEPWVYAGVDFAGAKHILEVGCGVGAQLSILLRRFPSLRATGVDRSRSQLEAAGSLLAPEVAAGRVTLVEADAASLAFPDAHFDGAFLCWILEHVTDPAALLKEAHRVLAPHSRLYSTEVYGASFCIKPRCAALEEYLSAFNAYQSELGGDPNSGVLAAARLYLAGFTVESSTPIVFNCDARTVDAGARSRYFDYWCALLKSGLPGLLAAGKVPRAIWRGVETDFARLKVDRDAVFRAEAIQTVANSAGA